MGLSYPSKSLDHADHVTLHVKRKKLTAIRTAEYSQNQSVILSNCFRVQVCNTCDKRSLGDKIAVVAGQIIPAARIGAIFVAFHLAADEEHELIKMID